MKKRLNENLIAFFAILFFIILTVSFSYSLFNKRKNAQVGLKVHKSAGNLVCQCLSHWQELDLISGNMSLNFWQKPVIVACVFNIEDCGICLARVDELIAFLDSITKNIEADKYCSQAVLGLD